MAAYASAHATNSAHTMRILRGLTFIKQDSGIFPWQRKFFMVRHLNKLSVNESSLLARKIAGIYGKSALSDMTPPPPPTFKLAGVTAIASEPVH